MLLFTLDSTEVSATTGKTRLLSLIKTALCGWVKIELITLIKLAIPIVSDAQNLFVFFIFFSDFDTIVSKFDATNFSCFCWSHQRQVIGTGQCW